MPIVNRLMINSINNDEHYEALVTRQTKNDKNKDAFRNYASFSVGFTVAAQNEDGGPWTNSTVVGRDHTYNNTSYMINITETGQIVTRNRKHIKQCS